MTRRGPLASLGGNPHSELCKPHKSYLSEPRSVLPVAATPGYNASWTVFSFWDSRPLTP